MTTATDSLLDDLLALARKGSLQNLEGKFLEAFAAQPEQLDIYLRVGEELKAIGKRTQAGNILSVMIEHYESKGTPEQRVRLLSFVACMLDKERAHRQILARALQDLHGAKPAFELFLDASGLKGDHPVEQALARLGRMWSYDVGRYVLHATGWGVGRVDGVDAGARELLLVFESDRRHSMPVQSAMETLQPVSDDDWRVLKHFQAAELRRLCEEAPGEVVARVLKQMGRPADVATMRINLEGSVIAASNWSRWWATARKAALTRPDVAMQGNRVVWRKVDVQDRVGAMRAALTAKQVRDLACDLLRNQQEKGPVDPKLLQDLFPVLFEGSAKHARSDDSSPLELLLLADEIGEQQSLNRVALDERLQAHFRDEETFFRRLSDLGNPKLEKRALDRFKRFAGATWPERLFALARVASARLLEQIVPDLVDSGKVAELKALLADASRKFDVQPELLVFARRRHEQARFAPFLGDVDPKSLVERCLSMGEQHGKAPNPRLRALQRLVAKELTDANARDFRALVKSLTLDNARLLMRKIEMLRGLTDHTKLIMLSVFGEVHRELAKKEEIAAAHLDTNVIYCTDDGIKRRNEEYEKLVNVELPKIFAAIGKAAAFGDLSENAEYTAALEERARLTKKAEEMVEELRMAKPLDGSLLHEGVATIGALVRARDTSSGKERTFALLGPWDADPEKGRIDYHAPLARAFMGHGVGETVRAEIGDKAIEFEILEVQPAI